MIIAIDGPAASGKSTIAKLLAGEIDFQYMDTGAMYRALTWKALKNKIDLSDSDALLLLARTSKISFSDESKDGIPRKIFIDDLDVSRKIRARRIENSVSLVAKVPGVRRAMVEQQRRLARKKDYVVEGRDIGTVVFPEAEVKMFITASVRERARRRQKDLRKLGHEIGLRALEREIVARDKIDSSREASPLTRAQDAHTIDTTNKTIPQVFDRALKLCLRGKQ